MDGIKLPNNRHLLRLPCIATAINLCSVILFLWYILGYSVNYLTSNFSHCWRLCKETTSALASSAVGIKCKT